MNTEDLDEDLQNHKRNQNAESVRTKTAALKTLKTYDFQKLFASGVRVYLSKMDGTAICDEFMINGEDMDKIKPAMIESLTGSLNLRKQLLMGDIKSIEASLA